MTVANISRAGSITGVKARATGGVTLYSLSSATTDTQTTYSVRVPDNVTSLAGLAIGAGGAGGGCSSAATAAAGGGGGGALSYSNAIAVTPGETLTVLIPNQSAAGTNTGGNGSSGLTASVARGATILLSAVGGSGSLGRTSTTASAGAAGGAAASGVGDTKFSGGTGGAGNASTDQGGGGGGAAGYAGNGGTGGTAGGVGGAAPTGGGGGGGSSTIGTSIQNSSGGGTLWYGKGASGAGGTTGGTNGPGGLGSSIGGATSVGATLPVAQTDNSWGLPGAGGAGAPSGGAVAYAGMRGAGGAVRLLWGPSIDWGTPTNTSDNFMFVRSTASSLTSSVTMPTVELGDTVIFIDLGQNTNGGPPASVTPSGFTSLQKSTGSNTRLDTYYKQIVTAADTGTTLTASNGNGYNSKMVIVIAGKRGASYSPRGSDTTLNGSVSAISSTGGSTAYSISATDTYATGIPVGIAFFNSSVNISPSSISYTGATNTITVAGADTKTFAKIGLYPQVTGTTYNGSAWFASTSATNTFAFWYSCFY